MPARSSLNVSLTPELEKFVQERVASGKYQTASEVVRQALRLLEADEQTYEEALARVRAKLKRGVEQAERGQVFTADEVFAELRRRSAQYRKRKAS